MNTKIPPTLDNQIQCPSCTWEYVRVTSVSVLSSNDDTTSDAINFKSLEIKDWTIIRGLKTDHRNRNLSVYIYFECEDCGYSWSEKMKFHKGMTFREVAIEPREKEQHEDF